MAKPNPVPRDIQHSRLWAKVNVRQMHECWPWQWGTNDRGYGRFRWRNTEYCAHRVAYTLIRGPIPDGFAVDHLCRNPSCCNPWHLEPVTPKENTRRAIPYRPTSWRRAVGGVPVCKNGHAVVRADASEYTHGHGVRCLACHRERSREYRRKKAA